MARQDAVLSSRLATPTLEVFRGLKHSITSVGTTATAIPATNLSNRKALFVQNIHGTANVYLGGDIPEVIGAKPKGGAEMYPEGATIKSGVWFPSGFGTNEWFFATSAKGDPGLTQAVALYTAAVGGAETVRTNGTVSSLAAEHGWGWGNADTLGFNTLYIRTDGTGEENSPARKYQNILSYFGMPATTSTFGIYLGPYDGISFTLCGSARLFAISNTSSTPILCAEFI